MDKNQRYSLKIAAAGIILFNLMMPFAFADVFINVVAVNGAPERRETTVKYNLPGDLKAEDIIDTNGLKLDYNINDANYYVHGSVALNSKESKTFRVRVKDIWKISTTQVDEIKAEIAKGFDQIGSIHDPQKAALLRQQLESKLDYITQQQGVKADSVEKRIDSFRAYRTEVKRIQEEALAVDYWRSIPGEKNQDKLVYFKIEVANAATNPTRTVKQKQYLPSEVRPENVVEAQGFEVRYDQQKQQAFLFKEEDIPQGQKRSYSIGIQDIWSIDQKEIDYLRSRANYAYDFLKNSKYDKSAKSLYDHNNEMMGSIEVSQTQELDIKEHIGAFRVNKASFDLGRADVENLEKLLSIYREDLEKSKVNNVLQKIRSFDGVASIAKQIFEKKPTETNTWRFMGWLFGFVGVLTFISFIIWIVRSQDRAAKEKK